MNPLGNPFIELSSVDSTNNYALSQVHAGLAQHGTAFFAHEQFAGKGQRGKIWKAERDHGIILSVVIEPFSRVLSRQFELSACIAVSVREFFSRYAGAETYIKWPNDLYWHDRKAGGILIENLAGAGEWKWAIAGMGININQPSFPEGIRNPVSLLQITGKNHDPMMLAKELCTVIDQNLQTLTEQGFETIYNEYNQHLYKRDQVVKLKKDNRAFEAKIIGVTRDGRLQTEHGIPEEFGFGEIEWILPVL